ncbi:MAG TPA: resolvase [Candidatus Dormibacteraeota bacterium]|nr:resolvase [Candidatus Dormibacteraeota bacterium]
MRVLGVDPGTRKVGLAVVEAGVERPLHLEVAALEAVPARVLELCRLHGVQAVAVGAQTGAGGVTAALRSALPAELGPHAIDERDSSYEARSLYWRLNPPKGLLRLIPRGMLFPPEALDGYAAAVIAGRFLEQRSRGKGHLKRHFVL